MNLFCKLNPFVAKSLLIILACGSILLSGCTSEREQQIAKSDLRLPLGDFESATIIDCDVYFNGIDSNRQFEGENIALITEVLSAPVIMVSSEKRTIIGQVVAAVAGKKIEWNIFYVDEKVFGVITPNKNQYSGLSKDKFVRLMSASPSQ